MPEGCDVCGLDIVGSYHDGVMLCPQHSPEMGWSIAVRALLDLTGWSRRALADHLGISPRTVEYWLTEQRRPRELNQRALLPLLQARGITYPRD